jgi:hypothetical protein
MILPCETNALLIIKRSNEKKRAEIFLFRGAQENGSRIMPPTAWDFQNQLMAILNAARQSGKPHIDVESNHLHAQTMVHPDSTHKMALCYEVMIRMMRASDSIVNELPDGKGVTIRYVFRVSAQA